MTKNHATRAAMIGTLNALFPPRRDAALQPHDHAAAYVIPCDQVIEKIAKLSAANPDAEI